MASHIQDNRVVMLPAGHAAHIEHPKLASELLKQFCLTEEEFSQAPRNRFNECRIHG